MYHLLQVLHGSKQELYLTALSITMEQTMFTVLAPIDNAKRTLYGLICCQYAAKIGCQTPPHQRKAVMGLRVEIMAIL